MPPREFANPRRLGIAQSLGRQHQEEHRVARLLVRVVPRASVSLVLDRLARRKRRPDRFVDESVAVGVEARRTAIDRHRALLRRERDLFVAPGFST